MLRKIVLLSVVLLLVAQFSWAARAKIKTVSADPYRSALVMDGGTGQVLFEENGDTVIYPASVLKLMVLHVVLERIEQGALSMDEMIQVTDEAARMGGSQVYLDPREQFSVEDLLYALMIQSANDAAVALAGHVGGSKDGFIALMNKKASELGMKNTHFYSVHGLPPSKGQKVDVSTARDLAILGRELAKKPETFKFTSAVERDFRGGEFVMRTHNHLLKSVGGCDGFKTGYFKAAGFSIIATAEREGVRIIAIVLGSRDRKVRDARAIELIEKGFAEVPARPQVAQVPTTPVNAAGQESDAAESAPGGSEKPASTEKAGSSSGRGILKFLLGFAAGFITCGVLVVFRVGGRSRSRRRGY